MRCGPDDLAEVDDLLLHVGDVAHDLLAAADEDVLLELLELVPDLAQHREAVVEGLVDDLVEQVAGALGEELLADLLVGAAALEQVLDRLQRLVRQRDDEVGADEQVQLARVQAPDLLVEDREVQDDEQVVRVLVDLRPLVAGHDVLEVERVEVEVLGQPGALEADRAPRCESSGCPSCGDLLYVRLSALRRRGDRGAVRDAHVSCVAVVVERRSALEWVFGGRHRVSVERDAIVSARLRGPLTSAAGRSRPAPIRSSARAFASMSPPRGRRCCAPSLRRAPTISSRASCQRVVHLRGLAGVEVADGAHVALGAAQPQREPAAAAAPAMPRAGAGSDAHAVQTGGTRSRTTRGYVFSAGSPSMVVSHAERYGRRTT